MNAIFLYRLLALPAAFPVALPFFDSDLCGSNEYVGPKMKVASFNNGYLECEFDSALCATRWYIQQARRMLQLGHNALALHTAEKLPDSLSKADITQKAVKGAGVEILPSSEKRRKEKFLYMLGQYKDAIKQMADFWSSDAEFTEALGDQYIENFKQAQALNPENFVPYKYLLLFLISCKQDPKEWMTYLDEAVAMFPIQTYQLLAFEQCREVAQGGSEKNVLASQFLSALYSQSLFSGLLSPADKTGREVAFSAAIRSIPKFIECLQRKNYLDALDNLKPLKHYFFSDPLPYTLIGLVHFLNGDTAKAQVLVAKAQLAQVQLFGDSDELRTFFLRDADAGLTYPKPNQDALLPVIRVLDAFIAVDQALSTPDAGIVNAALKAVVSLISQDNGPHSILVELPLIESLLSRQLHILSIFPEEEKTEIWKEILRLHCFAVSKSYQILSACNGLDGLPEEIQAACTHEAESWLVSPFIFLSQQDIQPVPPERVSIEVGQILSAGLELEFDTQTVIGLEQRALMRYFELFLKTFTAIRPDLLGELLPSALASGFLDNPEGVRLNPELARDCLVYMMSSPDDGRLGEFVHKLSGYISKWTPPEYAYFIEPLISFMFENSGPTASPDRILPLAPLFKAGSVYAAFLTALTDKEAAIKFLKTPFTDAQMTDFLHLILQLKITHLHDLKTETRQLFARINTCFSESRLSKDNHEIDLFSNWSRCLTVLPPTAQLAEYFGKSTKMVAAKDCPYIKPSQEKLAHFQQAARYLANQSHVPQTIHIPDRDATVMQLIRFYRVYFVCRANETPVQYRARLDSMTDVDFATLKHKSKIKDNIDQALDATVLPMHGHSKLFEILRKNELDILQHRMENDTQIMTERSDAFSQIIVDYVNKAQNKNALIDLMKTKKKPVFIFPKEIGVSSAEEEKFQAYLDRKHSDLKHVKDLRHHLEKLYKQCKNKADKIAILTYLVAGICDTIQKAKREDSYPYDIWVESEEDAQFVVALFNMSNRMAMQQGQVAPEPVFVSHDVSILMNIESELNAATHGPEVHFFGQAPFYTHYNVGAYRGAGKSLENIHIFFN